MKTKLTLTAILAGSLLLGAASLPRRPCTIVVIKYSDEWQNNQITFIKVDHVSSNEPVPENLIGNTLPNVLAYYHNLGFEAEQPFMFGQYTLIRK